MASATHVAQHANKPVYGHDDATGRAFVHGDGYIEFGAAGAVDSTNTSLPAGWSCARTSTGLYTITHPGSNKMRLCLEFIDVSGGALMANLKTISGATSKVFSTFDPLTGTHTLANPADGDGVFLIFSARM